MVQKIITRLTIGWFLLLAGCSITVEPITLDFGSAEMSKTVEITIQGILKWQVQCDEDWVTFNPDHGQTTEEVTVTVDRTDLAPGNYEALLTVVNKWKIPCSAVLVKMQVEEPVTTTTSAPVTTTVPVTTTTTIRPPTTTVPSQTTTSAPVTTTVPVTTTSAPMTTTVPVTTTTTPVTTTVPVTTTTTLPVTTTVPVTTSIPTTTTTAIAPPEDIPTLSEWGTIIFMTIIMGIGVAILVRRRML